MSPLSESLCAVSQGIQIKTACMTVNTGEETRALLSRGGRPSRLIRSIQSPSGPIFRQAQKCDVCIHTALLQSRLVPTPRPRCHRPLPDASLTDSMFAVRVPATLHTIFTQARKSRAVHQPTANHRDVRAQFPVSSAKCSERTARKCGNTADARKH